MPLSEQALVDCSWGYGNNGCDGGESERSYQWIIDNKCIPTEVSYGQYLMEVCGVGCSVKGKTVKGKTVCTEWVAFTIFIGSCGDSFSSLVSSRAFWIVQI